MKIYFLIFFKIFFILFFNTLSSEELKNSIEERKTDTYAFLQDFINSDLIFISSLGQSGVQTFRYKQSSDPDHPPSFPVITPSL